MLQIDPGAYYFDRGGGVSEYIKNISKRLAKNHDVTVFASKYGGHSRFEIIDGVKVHRFRTYAPSRAYGFSLELLLKLRKSDFDVIHGNTYQAFPMHLSLLANYKKLIISTHFHGSSHSVFRNCLLSLFKPIGKRTLENAEKIIAVSQYEKSLLCEYFKINPQKIVVIPCGVDFSEFADIKKQYRDFKSLLYVGRLTSYKGIQYLINLLPKLSDEIHLEIVGEGPFKPQLINLVARLNVHDRVHFYQKLSRRDLLQKFVDADLFVLLSSYEAFSMVIAEALVSGTRCIVSETSALTEWVDNKYCFGLKPPFNLDSLANLVKSLLKLNEEEPHHIFKHNKISDWNDVVKEIEKLYIK